MVASLADRVSVLSGLYGRVAFGKGYWSLGPKSVWESVVSTEVEIAEGERAVVVMCCEGRSEKPARDRGKRLVARPPPTCCICSKYALSQAPFMSGVSFYLPLQHPPKARSAVKSTANAPLIFPTTQQRTYNSALFARTPPSPGREKQVRNPSPTFKNTITHHASQCFVLSQFRPPRSVYPTQTLYVQ